MATKLSKILQFSLDEAIGERISFYRKLEQKWLHSWLRGKITDPYYLMKQFLGNLRLFIPMAWNWRSWDYTYTINVLCQLLRKSAKCMHSTDRHVGAEKTYRRQMAAAGMLEKAYEPGLDRTIRYLMYKNPMEFTRTIEGYIRMSHKEVTNKRIYDGMYAAADKRSRKVEEGRKKEAWAYLHKHLESFWD